MCTLILLDRIVPEFPVVVAANRDEHFGRPAAPPVLFRPDGKPAFVAPQDLEAGGTWMGINSLGVFVGLTNRPVVERDPRARSRGLLVLDALAEASAEGAMAELDRQADQTYTPFNLLAADGSRAWLASREAGEQRVRPLQPGVHVVCNRDSSDPTSGKVRRLSERLAGIDPLAPLPELIRGLCGVLAAHPEPSNPLENPCVHTPQYGTRSSSVLAIGRGGGVYRYSDGAPCETKYRDLSRLLDELQPALT